MSEVPLSGEPPKKDPVVEDLRRIGNKATESAKKVKWEGAVEVAKKLNDLGSAAADFPQEEQEQAADAFVKMMQDLGDAAANLAKSAKGQADAADAEKDNAKKATTSGTARKAAEEAEKYGETARQQADWANSVAKAVGLASRVIEDGPRKQNGQALAAKAAVDAANANQYATRAEDAAKAADKIAK